MGNDQRRKTVVYVTRTNLTLYCTADWTTDCDTACEVSNKLENATDWFPDFIMQ